MFISELILNCLNFPLSVIMEQYHKRHGKRLDFELFLMILYASCRRTYDVYNSGHMPYWYLDEFTKYWWILKHMAYLSLAICRIWKLYSESPSQLLKAYGVWNSGHTPYWRSYPLSKFIEDLKVYGVFNSDNTSYLKDTQNMLSSSAIKKSWIRRIHSWIRHIVSLTYDYKYKHHTEVLNIIHLPLIITAEFHHSKAPRSVPRARKSRREGLVSSC
jgi:hypothetical protein